MATPVEGGQAPGGGLVAKLGGSRNAAILAAGATVAAVALVGLRKGKSSGGDGASAGDAGFDSGPYDMWNQWQEEYEDLQEQINAQQAGQTHAVGPGWPPRGVLPAPIRRPPVPRPAPRGTKPSTKPKPKLTHKPAPPKKRPK